MNYRFKPQNKNKLYHIIEDIINNQLSVKNYLYGLKDIDVSLISDMSRLFSCYKDNINSDINRKIDWDDPRNDITSWDVSNVKNMNNMFYESHFNQPIGNWNVSNVKSMNNMFYNSNFNENISHWNISNVTDMYAMFADSSFNHNLYTWINQLNQNIYLLFFNSNSEHEKKYGSIDSINDFMKNQLTPQIWFEQYKKSNDKEKFQLLKLLKNRDKTFIEELNKLIGKYNIDIDY